MKLKNLRKSIIYFFGDIHRSPSIGGFSWGYRDRLIDYDTALKALQLVKPGDIGLHRNIGDLSNVFIKGFMKHAWLFKSPEKIIEAVSGGVLLRHPLHAMMSDYVVILRPNVPIKAKREAVRRARGIVGADYDDQFTFDIEIEASLFADKSVSLSNIKKYGFGISCTELVALAYVGHRRELGLYRVKVGSREVIMPDSYLSTRFDIVWASPHTEIAISLGLHEEGCEMLNAYWKNGK